MDIKGIGYERTLMFTIQVVLLYTSNQQSTAKIKVVKFNLPLKNTIKA